MKVLEDVDNSAFLKISNRTYCGKVDNQAIRNLLIQAFAVIQHPYITANPPNWEHIRAADELGTKKQIAHLRKLEA